MNKHTAVELAVKNTFFLYISNFIVQMIGMVVSIYIIRVLTVEDYGLYVFILGSMMFIHMFSTSSPSTVIARFVPEFIEIKAYRLIQKTYLISLLIVLFTLALFSVAFFFFRGWAESFFKLPGLEKYTFYIIYFVFGYISLMLGRTYNATFLLLRLSSFIHISAAIVRLILYFIFWNRINLTIVLMIESTTYSIDGMFQLAIPYFHIRRKMNDNVETRIPNLRKRMLKYASLSFFNEIGAGMINKSTNNYIISAISNPFYVGQYGFANKLNDIFMKLFPLNQIASILRPIFIRKYTSSNENSDILNRMFVFLYKFLFFILAPMCFLFITVSDIVIINIFDPKYIDTILITNAIFMFALFNSFQIPLGYVVQAIEHLEINLMSKIFFIYNIFGSILMMKMMGLIGVVIILGTSILFKNLFILIALRKHIKLSFPWVSIGRTVTVTLVIFIINMIFRGIFPGLNPFVTLALIVIMDIPLYLIGIKLYSPFENDEREMVNMFFRKIKAGFIKL